MEKLIEEVLICEYPKAMSASHKCHDKCMCKRLQRYAYELQKLVYEANQKNNVIYEDLYVRVHDIEEHLHQLERSLS